VVIVIPLLHLVVVSDIQPKSFNLHNTHQKVIAQLYSFTLRSQITDEQ